MTNDTHIHRITIWRYTVGSLIELLWFQRQPIAGNNLPAHVRNTEGYGFIEFEIPSSTVSTVFRQPLRVGGASALRGSAADLRVGNFASQELCVCFRAQHNYLHNMYIYIYIYICIHTHAYVDIS